MGWVEWRGDTHGGVDEGWGEEAFVFAGSGVSGAGGTGGLVGGR